VIFSNATFRTDAAYRRDFRAFSIGDLVDDVISSADIGYRKPHKEMFVAAVNAGETSPPKCVVLGDSEEKDIAPAKALGMKTVRVCIEQALPAASEADVVVSSLEDAASAVATWVH